METVDYNYIQGLKNKRIPLVFFDRHCNIPDTNNVLIDDFKGGFDATQHLIDMGCKKVVHFSGPQELEIYKKRKRAFKMANHYNGFKFN